MEVLKTFARKKFCIKDMNKNFVSESNKENYSKINYLNFFEIINNSTNINFELNCLVKLVKTKTFLPLLRHYIFKQKISKI